MPSYLDASIPRVTLQGPEMSATRALARAHKQPILILSTTLDEACESATRYRRCAQRCAESDQESKLGVQDS